MSSARLWWFSSNVKAADIRDASQDVHEYAMTVTGRVRRSTKKREDALGVKVVVNGQSLMLLRFGDEVRAFDDTCPHAGGDMALCDVEDLPPAFREGGSSRVLTCPSHAFRFDWKSGLAVSPPFAACTISPCATHAPKGAASTGTATGSTGPKCGGNGWKLRTWPCKVENGIVHVGFEGLAIQDLLAAVDDF
jgi:nitrite reductase/ring-hydroxylating ferredoxin subunit